MLLSHCAGMLADSGAYRQTARTLQATKSPVQGQSATEQAARLSWTPCLFWLANIPMTHERYERLTNLILSDGKRCVMLHSTDDFMHRKDCQITDLSFIYSIFLQRKQIGSKILFNLSQSVCQEYEGVVCSWSLGWNGVVWGKSSATSLMRCQSLSSSRQSQKR